MNNDPAQTSIKVQSFGTPHTYGLTDFQMKIIDTLRCIDRPEGILMCHLFAMCRGGYAVFKRNLVELDSKKCIKIIGSIK